MIKTVSYFILSSFEVTEAFTLTLEFKLEYETHTYSMSNRDVLHKTEIWNIHIILYNNLRIFFAK